MAGSVLQSPGYPVAMLSRLKELFDRGQLCDFVLVTTTEEIPVHSVVLCTASNFFKGLMNDGSMTDPKFFVQAFDTECIQSLVHFMYTGTLVLSQSNIWNMLALASQFDVPEVSELCQQFLKGLTASPQAAPTISSVQKKPFPSPAATVTKTDVAWSGDPSRFIAAVTEDSGTGMVQPGSSVIGTGTELNITQSIKQELPEISINPGEGFFDDDDDNHDDGFAQDFGGAEEEDDDDGGDDYLPATPQPTRGKKRGRPPKKSPSPKKKQKPAELTTPKRGRPRKGESATPKKTPKAKTSTVKPEIDMFRCLLCPTAFSHQCLLRIHLRQVHRSRGDQRIQFFKHRAFQQLGKAVHSPNCQRCAVSCQNRNQLLAHEVKKHSRVVYPYKCSICNQKFSKRKHLNIHRNRHSELDTTKKHKCSKCHRLFVFKKNLLKHNTVHHKSLMSPVNRLWSHLHLVWFCRQSNCQFRGRTKMSLVQHMSTTHPEIQYEDGQQLALKAKSDVKFGRKSGKSCICEVCGKTFPRGRYAVKLHMFAKHKIRDPKVKIYECPMPDCDFACVFKNYIARHLIKHRDDKPFSCSICSKTFKVESAIQKHVNKVHLQIRDFVCEICGMSFSEKAQLKAHIETHGDNKTYKCDMCDYATFCKGNYKTHLYGKHNLKMDEKMRIYMCDMCTFTTNVKYQFTEHKRTHENSRSYACEQCDKKFNTRKSMWGHMKKVHCPKDFHCEHCSYKAAVNSKLQDHIRKMHTHRNYKPYQCFHCGSQFAERWKCKNHIKEKHPGQLVNITKLDEHQAYVGHDGSFGSDVNVGAFEQAFQYYNI